MFGHTIEGRQTQQLHRKEKKSEISYIFLAFTPWSLQIKQEELQNVFLVFFLSRKKVFKIIKMDLSGDLLTHHV